MLLQTGSEQATDEIQHNETSSDAVSELGLIFEAFLLWLDIKA